MLQLGNLTEDQVIDFKFSTVDTDNAPITLGGTPALSVYKANGTTQSTAGITLTTDFDSLTGCHHVRIDTSADAFYATGNDYQVVITAGTVDGISVVGNVLAVFSIENRFNEVNVTQLGGDSQSLTDLKDFADAGYDPSTNKVEGVKLADALGFTVDGYTIQETLALLLAAAVGDISGSEAANPVEIEAADGSVVRISSVVDTHGNRVNTLTVTSP